MTLGQKQELFGRLLPKLLMEMHAQGYQTRLGEIYRPWNGLLAARAFLVSRGQHSLLAGLDRIYQERTGFGVHPLKLAIDINLFRDGKYLTQTEDHAPFGAYWKSLHELCRWGGDFSKPDGNHYSLSHHGKA